MLGVCIPAHNEENYIDQCLASVTRAARHSGLAGEPVKIVVVLDCCSDQTAEHAQAQFRAHYQDRDGHRHVHGANLGLDASVYMRLGGFQALACSEDQALVDALEAAGANIVWTAAPRVVTSARAYSHINGGFATTLRNYWR